MPKVCYRALPSMQRSCTPAWTHRALELWVQLLYLLQPQRAGPLHTALLEEENQPAAAAVDAEHALDVWRATTVI